MHKRLNWNCEKKICHSPLVAPPPPADTLYSRPTVRPLANKSAYIRYNHNMHDVLCKVLVEMKLRTCTMVRHESSMVDIDRRDNSSCIIPTDRPVRVRLIPPSRDRWLVCRSNVAAVFAVRAARSESERGTWTQPYPWSLCGTSDRNASRMRRVAVALRIPGNTEPRVAVEPMLPNEICGTVIISAIKAKVFSLKHL